MVDERPQEGGAGGGINLSNTTGSTIEPLYTKRQMRAFSVTESELNMLSIINGIAGACFSIGTGLIGLSVDVQQVLQGQTVTLNSVAHSARPLFVWGGVIFYALGLLAVLWRHNTLEIIKRETGEQEEAKGWGIRLWPPKLWRIN